jgi:D-tyrosyl-tRNA(Tyr) deacylase
MRAVVQRVREASVDVADERVAAIGAGLLVLCGVAPEDAESDAQWLARKIVHLRIFDDADGMMNRSLVDAAGALLAVSQFTLFASTRKGARPSYSAAAPPELAEPMFDAFVALLERELHRPVATGRFGANMQVRLVNDGPVTIWLDSQSRT